MEAGAHEAGEILEKLAEGIVLLGPNLRPVFANGAARRMLGFQREGSLPPRVPSEDVVALARRALAERLPLEEVITTWFPARRSLEVRASQLSSGELLVVLEDVTEELLSQKVRREFVAHASHELKSPVAGIQALAEALLQALGDDPESAARFAERIVAETDRLGRLIADLLDLSRLEDFERVGEEPVQLAETARRALDEVQADAEIKQMSIETRIDPDVWVRGDEQQLAVMIRNLLENAVRYTPEGGTIELAVTASDGHAVVQVKDNGTGIPQDAQGRVFERFYRIDRARSRDRGGTGLGLAIVKHVVELHGGVVTVESELGEGSTFTARLPASSDPGSMRSIAG